MVIAGGDVDTRDRQRTEALMEIAEAMKAIQKDIADLRANVRAIAGKIK
jgi:hypothetical protein